MSNVCCGMFNVVVKAPDDLLTKTPNLNGNDLVIRSFRQWVVLQVHRTSHNRHSIYLTVLAVVNFFTAPQSAHTAVAVVALTIRSMRARGTPPLSFFVWTKSLAVLM